jgi:hypothetical protein
MDTENKNNKEHLAEDVMEKIHNKKVSIIPHFYFITGSAFLGIGIFFVFLITMFCVNIFSFHFRVMHPMGLSQNFFVPIITLALGLISVLFGAILLRKCDFSYRKSFLGILIAFIITAVFFGIIIDISGFNERPRPPKMMNMMYRKIPEGNWISGYIADVSTSSANINVAGDGTKTIVWDENTTFPTPPFKELKQGDFIRIVGEENNGMFHARFIGTGRRPVNFRMR